MTEEVHSDVVKTFKLVLVGDGGVGKTTFVKRHRTGYFEKQYYATSGVNIRTLYFQTNYGKIAFQVWDTAGQEYFGGIRTAYYVNADCAILMFDLTSKESYNNIHTWWDNLTRITTESIPMVLVGNKFDITDRKVQMRQVTFHLRKMIQYFEVSAKTNYNFEKPFKYLLTKLTGKDDLEILDEHALLPSGVELTDEQVANLQKGYNEADEAELPDMDDDF
eukprot:TRINITY_DN2738_c0_g1_i3.p1 TRINITY_DN2738_c0_g1~~TRINITY_DN2738_c0_g1_i3.p1  ORF type:complete len:232 (+),score=64.19 TRINITY_DN2738_c0_g1_i3:39-698(+)